MTSTQELSEVQNDQASQELLAVIGNKKDEKKKKKTFGNVIIERTDGEKIVLPEGMTYADARAWLEKIEKSEETIVNFRNDIKAYPWDGAYALFRAMQEQFGYADAIATKDPSGSTPPQMINLKLPDNTFVSVPWGKLQFPGLDDKSYLETSYNRAEMKFVIVGQIKRKFEKAVQALMLRTEKILKERSIYKGNAIRVDLAFLDDANIPMSQPEFLNNSVKSINEEDVLLDDITRLNYASVLLRIKQTKRCVKNGIQVKHGCLLAGPYGTGKTLLAKFTAKEAIASGWSFIYLENAKQLKHALRLAEMYAPCVVFTEDIDKAVEGTARTEDMNAILNTLDGIDTKSNHIITVLTTNHLENINKAFLRAGRIDSLVEMKPLNNDTAKQFLQRFASDKDGISLLNPDGDYTKAAAALAGIVPAFASEVINKAKMYSMYNNRELLDPSDIETAAESFKEHIRLTTENIQLTPEQIVAENLRSIHEYSTKRSEIAELVTRTSADLKLVKANLGIA